MGIGSPPVIILKRRLFLRERPSTQSESPRLQNTHLLLLVELRNNDESGVLDKDELIGAAVRISVD
jgi:hypothetical protein